MLKHRNITIERIEKFIEPGQFSDVNLTSFLWDQEYPNSATLELFSVPDLARISFEEAVKSKFKPVNVGVELGPTWSTHWFKVTLQVPKDVNDCVFIFDSDSEALIWSENGEPLQGLTGGFNSSRHVDFPIKNSAGQTLKFYVEVAANGLFGAGRDGDGSIAPPNPDKYYSLREVAIKCPNNLAFSLLWDFEVLIGIIRGTSENDQTNADALYCANAMVNAIHAGDKSSLLTAKEISNEFFEPRKRLDSALHSIWAIGNCHIDTAWLWPFDETKRKSARSWATQCRLIEEYPDYKFAASQAQQFEWVEQLYPKLFSTIKNYVAEERFIPIGGTWVEMDCNMPSGESLCRQFLYGNGYFMKKFGVKTSVFWLPDTFGYAAQLPQIVKQAGLKYFFTQKLSWNNINKFPHSTFYWKGLDGTKILTHFSPTDTYTAQGTVQEVIFTVKNNKDKLYSNKSMLLFGNGDGGGGPLIPMIERLKRMASLEGLPANVKFEDPNKFYDALDETSKDLNTWHGELYFELHRGTYTSHGIIKKYNRKCEFLLRDVEMLYSYICAFALESIIYPQDELDRLWKLVLLNQFHDVIPGSSIGLVYIDALKFYEDVIKSATALKKKAFKVLSRSVPQDKMHIGVFNSKNWPFKRGLVEIEIAKGEKVANNLQICAQGTSAYAYIDGIAPLSFQTISVENSLHVFPVTVQQVEKFTIVENNLIRCKFNSNGHIVELFDIARSRHVVDSTQPANVFRFFEDIPLFWDAWDVEIYHLEKSWLAGVGELSIIEHGPLRVVLKVTHPLSEKSTLDQKIIISTNSAQIVFENEVFWDENRKMLKVEFPVLIKNDFATYETQFGYIQRPTHFNNSWDMARFEVCAHKFVDFSEYQYGVALFNDCKYGFSVKDSVIRMSILRAPKAPDDNCDIGKHTFKYAFEPHFGSFAETNIVQKGYEFNTPIEAFWAKETLFTGSLFKTNTPNVILDTVKKTQEKSDFYVVRLYEAYGGRGTLTLSSDLQMKHVYFSNIMEEMLDEVFIPFQIVSKVDASGKQSVEEIQGDIKIDYSPFQIITLLVSFK